MARDQVYPSSKSLEAVKGTCGRTSLVVGFIVCLLNYYNDVFNNQSYKCAKDIVIHCLNTSILCFLILYNKTGVSWGLFYNAFLVFSEFCQFLTSRTIRWYLSNRIEHVRIGYWLLCYLKLTKLNTFVIVVVLLGITMRLMYLEFKVWT